MELTSERYYAERERERQFNRNYYHTCCECGLITKPRLAYCHPNKDGMVCDDCAAKLWGRV